MRLGDPTGAFLASSLLLPCLCTYVPSILEEGSGAASPELGLWAGTQTCRIRLQRLAHVSAWEKSARETTSVIHSLGAQGISLQVCGAEDPGEEPWEPGTLRAALSLGGQATAGGALHLPFPSL